MDPLFAGYQVRAVSWLRPVCRRAQHERGKAMHER